MKHAFRLLSARQQLARLRAEAALLRATIVIQRAWRRYALRAAEAKYRAASIIQRSLQRYAFFVKREFGAVKIQTQFRYWSATQKYSTQRIAALRIQTHWRQFASKKKFREIIRNVILIQSSFRRWQYGALKVRRRKEAILIVQQYARGWLAVRLLVRMKKHRADSNRYAIICQVSYSSRCSCEWYAISSSRPKIMNLRRPWSGETYASGRLSTQKVS